MTHLEDLQPHTSLRGILPDGLVTVVTVQWFGSEAVVLTYKDPGGGVANERLYRHDEARLHVVQDGRPWSFDGDGHLFRLVSEAQRIRLAHLFDLRPPRGRPGNRGQPRRGQETGGGGGRLPTQHRFLAEELQTIVDASIRELERGARDGRRRR